MSGLNEKTIAECVYEISTNELTVHILTHPKLSKWLAQMTIPFHSDIYVKVDLRIMHVGV